MVILVMGVSGAGKTVVGRELARQLGWIFVDADEEHTAANVARMSEGMGLTDADRVPWLEAIRARVSAHVRRGENVVLACSALKRAYRTRLADIDDECIVVHLRVPAAILAQRLRERSGHFAGPDLLASQFRDLEPPEDAVVVDASASIAEVVTKLRERLNL